LKGKKRRAPRLLLCHLKEAQASKDSNGGCYYSRGKTPPSSAGELHRLKHTTGEAPSNGEGRESLAAGAGG